MIIVSYGHRSLTVLSEISSIRGEALVTGKLSAERGPFSSFYGIRPRFGRAGPGCEDPKKSSGPSDVLSNYIV
jgi:hypothetical protein